MLNDVDHYDSDATTTPFHDVDEVVDGEDPDCDDFLAAVLGPQNRFSSSRCRSDPNNRLK